MQARKQVNLFVQLKEQAIVNSGIEISSFAKEDNIWGRIKSQFLCKGHCVSDIVAEDKIVPSSIFINPLYNRTEEQKLRVLFHELSHAAGHINAVYGDENTPEDEYNTQEAEEACADLTAKALLKHFDKLTSTISEEINEYASDWLAADPRLVKDKNKREIIVSEVEKEVSKRKEFILNNWLKAAA